MTNVNLEAGEWEFDDLIADTTTASTWS